MAGGLFRSRIIDCRFPKSQECNPYELFGITGNLEDAQRNLIEQKFQALKHSNQDNITLNQEGMRIPRAMSYKNESSTHQKKGRGGGIIVSTFSFEKSARNKDVKLEDEGVFASGNMYNWAVRLGGEFCRFVILASLRRRVWGDYVLHP